MHQLKAWSSKPKFLILDFNADNILHTVTDEVGNDAAAGRFRLVFYLPEGDVDPNKT